MRAISPSTNIYRINFQNFIAMIIKFDFRKNVIRKSVKRMSIAAATAAMAMNLGLTAEETEAAKAALQDIAREGGARQARAIIADVQSVHPDDGPFGGLIA